MAGVVGTDDMLAVLVVTATFHLNIIFSIKINQLPPNDQNHYQVLLEPRHSDLVGRIIWACGRLLPGHQSHLG